jgi:ATP-dependent Clp protease ATP-binding subunit ClpA
VNARIAERGLTLELDSLAEEELIKSGFDQRFGARPMRRAVESKLENGLSEFIMANQLEENQSILVSVTDGKLSFSAKKKKSIRKSVQKGQET